MPETAAVVVPQEEVMTEPASAARITEDGERLQYNTDHSLLDVAAFRWARMRYRVWKRERNG